MGTIVWLSVLLAALVGDPASLVVPQDSQNMLLVSDVPPSQENEPCHFRMARSPFESKRLEAARKSDASTSPSRQGLDELKLSGSAEFSATSLPLILATLNQPELTIVDLRQESHGFVNGWPVEWWGASALGYGNATGSELVDLVMAQEKSLLAGIAAQPSVTIWKIDQKDKLTGLIAKMSPLPMDVKQVLSEQELVTHHGVRYFRIPVIDEHAPIPSEVDRFVGLVQSTGSSGWLHFHCQDGHGRTTTFLTLRDMMANAKEVSLETIITRQWLIGGVNLLEMPPPQYHKYAATVTRKEFLQRFYDYCRSESPHFATPWSAWIVANPPANASTD